MTPFNLNKSPLTGAHLIEAGAGTGKTYAIAALYVRFIIERSLPVREILVVTFTLAATAELKERIRSKLREALEAFTTLKSKDSFLLDLLNTFTEPAARRQACERLRIALQDFDEAAVFTIHGFCKRMLYEHAFESGTLFDTEFVTDQRGVLEEIINDFWRTNFYEAMPELVGYALGKKLKPDAMIPGLQNMAANPDIRISPDVGAPSLSEMRKLLDDFHATVSDIRTIWPSAREGVSAKLQDKALNGKQYNAKIAQQLTAALDAWLTMPDAQLFSGFEKMTPQALAKAARKNAAPPADPVFALCARIWDKACTIGKVFDAYLLSLKANLIRTIRVELPARKQKQNILFYDDLLLKLRDALKSEGGDKLAESVGNQFKAALIDEFQDTDPVQYSIFKTVFCKKDHALFLIGDPKQAIYSFRGADIFAYMKAAAEAESRYTLDLNWRSLPQLIVAVNALFSRNKNPFVFAEISFRPATAAPVAERKILTLSGKEPEAFVCWFLRGENEKPVSAEAARSRIADAVAAEISRLTTMGRECAALIGKRPVTPGDIAVLVRTNREARIIRRSLQGLFIPCILTSEENVFDSREAVELYEVLYSISRPFDESLVRGALTTDMLGADAQALARWLNDDASWSARLETFRSDREQWEAHGLMNMFRAFSVREGVRSRLLSFLDGERRLTNVLHLVEILHQESVTGKPDLQMLLKWFDRQLNKETREARDEHMLRLESDADSVKIMTIHKSKGLEFPIVFCPYTWGKSASNTKKDFIFHDEKDNHEPTLDIGSGECEEHLVQAQKEQLAENCRLLYVAVTRAMYRCYFAWGRINQTAGSAPAYLLHKNSNDQQKNIIDALETHLAGMSDGDMLADLENIAAKSDGAILLEELPETAGLCCDGQADFQGPLSRRLFNANIDTSWKIASYSMLVSGPPQLTEMPDRDVVSAAAATEENQDNAAFFSHHARQSTDLKTIFSFPGGIRSGILLHDLFEHFDFTEGGVTAIRSLVAEKLQSHGFDREWEDILTLMLKNVAACPLPRPDTQTKPALTLSRIGKTARLNELEFFFPLKTISRDVFGAAFDDVSIKETGLERLYFSPVKGFMRGFIDLVFVHAGRYYIVDWKSNVLGRDITDYSAAKLAKAMREHFYTLQSRLYAVALNEYLRVKQPDYDYDKHFGGIYYLFIRGMDPAYGSAYGIFAERPPRRFMEKFRRLLIPA